MIKNWITLGDAAFDSDEMPIGVVHINEEDVDHWADITIEQLYKAARSPKVQQMASQADRISFDLLLYKGALLNKLIRKKLTDAVSAIFNNVRLGTFSVRTSQRTQDNMVFVSFEDLNGWPLMNLPSINQGELYLQSEQHH